MKTKKSLIVCAIIAFFIATTCFADVPPPPPELEPEPVPIDNGILILVALALSYGFYIVYKNKKRAA